MATGLSLATRGYQNVAPGGALLAIATWGYWTNGGVFVIPPGLLPMEGGTVLPLFMNGTVTCVQAGFTSTFALAPSEDDSVFFVEEAAEHRTSAALVLSVTCSDAVESDTSVREADEMATSARKPLATVTAAKADESTLTMVESTAWSVTSVLPVEGGS